MISVNKPKRHFEIGDEVFLPFWIIIEFLDATPPTPFVKCQILSISTRRIINSDGAIDFDACDLNLGKPDLIAQGIPINYLIHGDDLIDWARQIAEWFISYPATVSDVLKVLPL